MDPGAYNHFLIQTRASSLVLRSLLVNTFRRNFSSRAAQVPLVGQKATYEVKGKDAYFRHNYDVTLKDESADDSLMVVRVAYEVCLYCESEPSDEFLEEYQVRQLPLITRPYLRELISNLSPRSLIQSPPIPAQFVQPVSTALAVPADSESQASAPSLESPKVLPPGTQPSAGPE